MFSFPEFSAAAYRRTGRRQADWRALVSVAIFSHSAAGMIVTLIGMKHCGKSTLGRLLAARWNCPFYDVDRLIEERHACQSGMALGVREIYSSGGERQFQQLETQVVCQLHLSLSRDRNPAVIALGGRTALNQEVDTLLADLGLIVYLEVPADELFERVLRSGLPPFLEPTDPRAHFRRLCRERDPLYRRLAQLTVPLGGLDTGAALEALCRHIEEHIRAQAPPENPSQRS